MTNCPQLNANKSAVLLVGRDNGLWSEQWWPNTLESAPTPKSVVKKSRGVDRLDPQFSGSCQESGRYFFWPTPGTKTPAGVP